MAKDKKTKPVGSKHLNNPFGSLKGFAVSAEQPPVSVPVKNPADEPVSDASEQVDFDAQMARLGVQRLNSEKLTGEEDRAAPAVEIETNPQDCEQDLFLSAMTGLNVPFADHLDHEEPLSPGAPRRMKQLRRGTLVPEATLDLHGTVRQEVEVKMSSFIANARYHGWQVLLVITGKGLHSPEGEGVLRSAVEEFLQRGQRDLVAEWGRAPRRYGGDGAIVLFLRRQQG
ncbi:Smr/MutS family protein [Pelovirga terrestris]|uniref:Smr/MutS family protein n=1 Tax=Pelovirga terrestris TaxID=2771352 RepID=A0A8J6QT04_9BACT|nr:Smr/MutS family protein [Pelovirga terrestris]MBD1401350.1 Smr/MutS family protein [Pelovirga terrestris]